MEARPPAPPLTQLQLDAIRDTIGAFVDELAGWHQTPRDELLSVCWLFFFHLAFSFGAPGCDGAGGLTREAQARLLEWWNATRDLREASDGA